MNWVKALKISSMYITRKSAIKVPMYFKGAKRVEMALLDSGATENFLDYRMVQKLKINTTKLPQPR